MGLCLYIKEDRILFHKILLLCYLIFLKNISKPLYTTKILPIKVLYYTIQIQYYKKRFCTTKNDPIMTSYYKVLPQNMFVSHNIAHYYSILLLQHYFVQILKYNKCISPILQNLFCPQSTTAVEQSPISELLLITKYDFVLQISMTRNDCSDINHYSVISFGL